MSEYTPSTEELRNAYRFHGRSVDDSRYKARGKPPMTDAEYDAEFDRWLDRVKAEARESVVTPEAREHWEWTQKSRRAHGDRGCVCALCGVMERVHEKGESND